MDEDKLQELEKAIQHAIALSLERYEYGETWGSNIYEFDGLFLSLVELSKEKYYSKDIKKYDEKIEQLFELWNKANKSFPRFKNTIYETDVAIRKIKKKYANLLELIKED